MTNRRTVLVSGFALVLSGNTLFAKDLPRDPNWAVPITLAGVPNLNQVGPNIFRSAQPTPDGFKALESKLGIKTVLSLRNFHSDLPLLSGTTLDLKSVPMDPLYITTDEVTKALSILVAESKLHPVLVHCQHGSDRTGVVMAMYRVVVQGWDKDKAIAEMENGGFGFHAIFFNIPNFVKNADIAKYRQVLAISP